MLLGYTKRAVADLFFGCWLDDISGGYSAQLYCHSGRAVVDVWLPPYVSNTYTFQTVALLES
jgi:hypothetical protein